MDFDSGKSERELSKDEKVVRLKEGERAAGVATLTALAFALMKGVIGFLSGSVALIGDAFHTGADSIATFASWFGLKIAQRRPDEKFPYGYYKGETMATLFVCAFILYAGYELLEESYSKLLVAFELGIPYWALGISLISAAVSFFMARYEESVGKKINSQSLLTNAQESKVNILASVLVFIGILCTYFRIPYVEGSVGILLSLMIFRIGLVNGKVALFSLMDVSSSKEIEKEAERVITSIPGVEDFEDFKLRRAGPYIFGEVKVKIRKFVDVGRAHEISESIENRIKADIRQIDSFTIHMEPYRAKTQRLAVPIRNKKGLDSEIMDHFGRAKYYIFIDLEEGEIKSHYIKDNPHREEKARAGLTAAHGIVDEKVDALITRQIGEISFHTLRDHLVDVYLTKRKIIKDAIQDFIDNRLERLREPTREMGTEQFLAKSNK